MKHRYQMLVMIGASMLLFSSCSEKKECVIEHKWQVEKIQKYPHVLAEKYARSSEGKDTLTKMEDIIMPFLLPSIIKDLDEIDIIEFTGTFLIVYDKKGNLMQKTNYTVSASKNNKKIIEIGKEKYEFIKTGENNAIFRTAFADFHLRLKE